MLKITVTEVSRISTHGHLNITCYFSLYRHLPGVSIVYILILGNSIAISTLSTYQSKKLNMTLTQKFKCTSLCKQRTDHTKSSCKLATCQKPHWALGNSLPVVVMDWIDTLTILYVGMISVLRYQIMACINNLINDAILNVMTPWHTSNCTSWINDP